MILRIAAIVSVFVTSLCVGLSAHESTLVYCTSEGPDTFNPQLTTSRATFDATARLIYDRLTRFSDDGARIEPALAKSWRISQDGRRYSFELRTDAVLHRTALFTPTRNLNADDVVFTFARQRDPKHPFHEVSGGRYAYFAGMGLNDLIRSVERTGEFSVTFTLTRPSASFLAILAMDFASILSAEYAQHMLGLGMPEQVDREPVGSGPFRFVSRQRDALVRYAAHVAYWGGAGPVGNLDLRIVPDASVRFQKLRSGECHIIDAPDPADLPAMQADPDINLIRRTEPDVAYLAFNTQLPKFSDPRVRRALAIAIDRATIVEEAYHGLAVPADDIVPPTLWPSDRGNGHGRPELAEARRLISESGASGLTVTIWAPPVRRPYLPRARRVAELIRADWQKIGVDATIVVPDWKDFLKNSMVGEHEAILFGWTGETVDPDIFLTPILSCEAAGRGANRSRWCNPDFDRLLAAALTETVWDARTVIYRKALSILKEEVPITALVHSVSVTPVRANVTGYRPPVDGGHAFFGVGLE